MVKLLSTLPLPPTLHPLLPNDASNPIPWTKSLQLPILIEKSQSIFQNLPRHQNRGNKFTDAPDPDKPNYAEDDSADAQNSIGNNSDLINSKKIQYSLRKFHQYFKNSHNTIFKLH